MDRSIFKQRRGHARTEEPCWGRAAPSTKWPKTGVDARVRFLCSRRRKIQRSPVWVARRPMGLLGLGCRCIGAANEADSVARRSFVLCRLYGKIFPFNRRVLRHDADLEGHPLLEQLLLVVLRDTAVVLLHDGRLECALGITPEARAEKSNFTRSILTDRSPEFVIRKRRHLQGEEVQGEEVQHRAVGSTSVRCGNMARAMNFNAGLSALPLAAIERVQAALLEFKGSGMSVLEASQNP